ncbi:hypothetical protein CGZ75_19810 [Paenibacillus herberti]|uniref:Uncharacterized protein n=1 Tax=Paenibacillus herberti TaxID=1619309 RepID=A0A229NTT4_9BACL|nr:hypothetical protein CGZ75_19810 [Paenibacillus herberti]
MYPVVMNLINQLKLNLHSNFVDHLNPNQTETLHKAIKEIVKLANYPQGKWISPSHFPFSTEHNHNLKIKKNRSSNKIKQEQILE